MGYQALLFCPDEKTARTVTQVLSELDFIVVPCTEPFAAVKKLMGERFDAVVVDCDNEQNATLLFKSARNTPDNHSALAVAVVEGQAGVAKAFRIGANLVLTKPINVEQAKGTLRVARGLLRKSEAGKPAPRAASPVVKPAAPAPLPPKAAPQHPVPSADIIPPAAPIAPVATARIPAQKPASQPSVVASVPVNRAGDDDDIFEVSEEDASPSIASSGTQTPWPKVASASWPAKAEPTIEIGASQPASSTVFGTSAASAPAPAREAMPEVSAGRISGTTVSLPKSPAEKVAAGEAHSSAEENPAAAPAFIFGGNVDEAKSSGGGKKALVAVVAIVLIAAVGFAAWMQWGRSSDANTVPTRTPSHPVTAPAAIPQVAPKEPSAAASSASIPAASPASSSSQPLTADTARTRAENAPSHSKSSSEAELPKPSPSSGATKAAPTHTEPQPIVLKNGGAKPAEKSAASDAQAPSLTGIAPASNGATLPNLIDNSTKAPTPVLQTLSVSQGVSQGLLVKKVQPTYPPNALRLRLEGAVQLLATISKNGDISAVKILSGEPQLARAAVDAVKQWKYKPYLLNGSPVEIQTQVTVKFTLPH